jgi:predicted ATP-grasp superfamily ATP-dependent carboligase
MSPGVDVKAARLIADHYRSLGIDMLIPVDTAGIRVARLAQSFLPGMSTFPMPHDSELSLLDNKWTFYQHFRHEGIPFPATVLLERSNRLSQLELRFPLMIKPPDLEDGKGVKKLASLDELRRYLSGGTLYSKPPLLLQEYVPGTELGLSMLAHDGEVLAWTLQEHTKTGGLLFTSNHRILELGKSIMSATGFTGLAHFDLMRDSRNGEVKMLECNPRLWGTVRDSMLYGVNFLQLGMDLAMGREVRCSSDHPDLLCSGSYDLLKRILAGRRGWREINHPSLQGFVQVLKDPLPYLCFELQDATKKRAKVRAGGCRYQ